MFTLVAFLCTFAACIAVDISLESQSVDILIEDRYASINYTFYFVNTNHNNPSELSFEISLQPHTFISYFIAELNGDVFKGETKEKSQAQTEYNKAVESGLNAVLVSQDHDANVFNVQTNIENGGNATLQITAETLMLRRFGYYELSLLITDIYYGINSVFTTTDIVININDEYPISYADIIAPTNAYYNIFQVSSNSYNIDIGLQRSESTQQQLILLRYKTDTMDNINQLLYDDESMTFMHIFSYEDQYAVLPRRVVFVLDRSGSMGTNKWNAAVSATIGAIQNLKVGIDRMNVILFDSYSQLYLETIVSVTSDIKTKSISWISGYQSGGSTNLYQGVIDALNLIESDTLDNELFNYVNQVILVTDGQPTAGVTDPIQIQTGLLEANDKLEPASAAIFCLGIGDDYGNDWVNDLNYPLLRSIATQNGGFDVRVKESETETILNEYYNILESPLLTYIVLNYASYTAVITNTNEAESVTQSEYRQLYAGTDIVTCGKVSDNGIMGIIISLFARRGGDTMSTTFTITTMNDNTNNMVIDRIWAYLRLKMYRNLLDYPFLEVLESSGFESKALSLALEYELVTPWTSMIVVDDEVDNDIKNITNSNNKVNVDQEVMGDMYAGYGGAPPMGGVDNYYYSNDPNYFGPANENDGDIPSDVDGGGDGGADDIDEKTSDQSDDVIVQFKVCITWMISVIVILNV